MKLEIAVQDSSGAALAARAGADRVELCVALGATGGLTPSAGLIDRAVATGIGVHVLVRPRAGDFEYDEAEIETMVADVAIARSLGAAGVVVGALRDGAIHETALRAMIDAADGAEVTFHRALDTLAPADRLAALDRLAELGVTRVLTSGGAPRVGEGLDELRAMAERAAGRIQVQAGGGLRLEDIAALAAAGLDAVHLSAKRTVTSGPAGPGGGADGYEATDERLLGDAVAAVRALGQTAGETA